MSELEPRHQSLLGQLRTEAEPPPEQLDAVLDRVLAVGPAPATAATTLTLLKGGLVVLAIAGLAAIPLLGSQDSEEPLAAAPEVPAAVQPAPVQPKPEPAPQQAAVPEPAPDEAGSSPQPSAPKPRPERPREHKAGVADEVALMGRIRRAIQAGESQRALGLLRQHERRYPDGVFADERRVSQAEALCAAGETERGARIASAFIDDKPSSPLARRARRACDEQAPPGTNTRKEGNP